MSWFVWALLSAFFAGVTAVLAKVGVRQIDSNMATAIRTVVILIFAWSVALLTDRQPLSVIGRRTWIFLILSGVATSLSWLCYFRALQLGEASQVAPVDPAGRDLPARTSHLASLAGGHADFRGRGRVSVCVIVHLGFLGLPLRSRM